MSSFNWSPIQPNTTSVTTLDGMSGALTLVAGTGISIVDGTGTITISSTSAGDVTLGAFGSTPNANGLSISGSQVLNMQPADATHPGGISIADWNTFNNKQAALTIGNFTEATSSVLTITGGTGAIIGSGLSVQVKLAATAQSGYLSSTDWNTFNNKQSALTLGNLTAAGTDGIAVTSGTGAVVGSGTSIAQHVADSSHNGYLTSADWTTFNNKQSSLTLTNLTDVGTDGITITNGTGAVVGASPVTISQQAADATHNGYLTSADWSTFNSKQAAGTYVTAISIASSNGFAGSSSGGATPALTLTTSITGVLKGNGTAISAATSGTDYSAGTSALGTGILKSTTSTGALTIAVAGDFPTLNQNTTGSAASLSATLAIGSGGTGQTTASAAFNALSPMTTGGDLIYGGASGVGTRLANGSSGQVLTSSGGTSAPTWAAVSATASFNYVAKSANYTAVANDYINMTSNTFNITLPTAVGVSGQSIAILQSGSGVGSILTTSSQTIGGLASNVIKMASVNDTLVVTSDGANWQMTTFNVAVAAYYNGTPTGTLSAAWNNVTYGTKIIDTASGMSGATYTVPIGGVYHISASINISGTYVLNTGTGIAIYFGGTQAQAVFEYAGGAIAGMQVLISEDYRFATGATVAIQSYVPATGPAFASNGQQNWFSITRVGN